jgi:glycosyltransferase involved in cell wall biosynthesis
VEFREALTIAHVVFSSRLAGGERHCVDLANAQAALGHCVHVIGTAGSAVRAALAPNVEFHGLALPLLRGRRVAALVRRLGAQVCHGHLGPACKAVARVPGVARVGTLHVGYKAHHHARMDALVCVNRAQFRGLPDERQACAEVVYNWAPVRPESRVVPGRLRAELGLQDGQRLVGFLGRLHLTKGVDLLAEAFSRHAPPDACLALLGDGPARAELEACAARDPRIRLLGQREDVEQALADFDLFVSPSREDAFPLAVLEAMRAGCPIVASETQGPLEMLAGQPASLVPVGDADALGRALAEALRAPRERLSYAMDAFGRDQAVARIVALYRQAVRRRALLPEAISIPEGHEPALHA